MKKNRYTRAAALLLAVVMALSFLPQARAYGISSNWAKPELDRMEELGLIPESLEKAEDLRRTITRQEMCEVAVLAYETFTGEEIQAEELQPFTDTASVAVAKAYALGLTNGYGNGTFGPEDSLTREQFFTITYRFLALLGSEPVGNAEDVEFYTDYSKVGKWAQTATLALVHARIVQGSGGQLSPKDQISCEQTLVLFCRTYELLTSGGYREPARLAGAAKWALPQLQEMDDEGLIPGILLYDDLSKCITRREMCYVVVKSFYAMWGMPYEETRPSPFTDVSDPAVTSAYYLGIVSGYGDGTFGPNDPVTREQLYTITVNFLMACGFYRMDAPGQDLKEFSDAGQVSSFALPATRLLVDMGIVKGSGGLLMPKDYTDQQSALLLFYRSYVYLEDWLYVPPVPDEPERPLADQVVDLALSFVGYPYVWAGASPSTGFDCSGLVYYVFKQVGISVAHGATSQWKDTKGWRVEDYELLPGDLLFFSQDGGSSMYHVAIYIGNDQYVHAANSSRGVVVDTINWTSGSWFQRNYWGAKRYIP